MFTDASPLVAGLHWAASLAELYSATHAHPDMEEERKRRRSFPPNWTAVSGSSVSSESLAQAGFFYSCRRFFIFVLFLKTFKMFIYPESCNES